MATALRRRTVYAMTILAMVAMTSGFVLAAGVGGFAVTSSGGANSGSTTVSGTIYAGAVTSTIVALTAPPGSSCAATGPYAGSDTTGTASVDVSITGSACAGSTTAPEVYDALVFTSTALSAGTIYKDSFTITPSNPSGTTQVLTWTVQLTLAGTESLTVYVDMGTETTFATTGLSELTVVAVGA
jgi:hypothetical protein